MAGKRKAPSAANDQVLGCCHARGNGDPACADAAAIPGPGLWDRPRGMSLAATLLLALAATPGASADRAGNRIVAFAQVLPAPPSGENQPDRSARHCTQDRNWCAQLRRDRSGVEWDLYVFSGAPVRPGAGGVRHLVGGTPGERLTIWPHIVRQTDGAVLIGIERERRAGYSGGGARIVRRELVRIDGAGAAAGPVLEVPVVGTAMIRACFSPSDERRRAGACHDEYAYEGVLALDPTVREGRPTFILTTRARTFPGRVRRDEDSGERPQLRRRDLVWSRDEACSYTRRFGMDSATGLYAPDAPLPDCADYLDLGD